MSVSGPKAYTNPLIEAMDVQSGLNGGAYELRIGLPRSYPTGTERYPILVVLDAGIAFGTAYETASLETMWSRSPLAPKGTAPLPELIVVGVDMPDRDTRPLRRNYEYMPESAVPQTLAEDVAKYKADIERLLGQPIRMGGAPKFLEVLHQEILPAIDAQYRTDATRRMLFGVSAGGAFCCYTLLTRPETFTDYIIASPGLIDDEVFRLEATRARSHSDLQAGVFLSAGEAEVADPLAIFSRTARLAELLQFRQYPSLHLKTWFVREASHVQTAAPSIARGLNELYAQRPWRTVPVSS